MAPLLILNHPPDLPQLIVLPSSLSAALEEAKELFEIFPHASISLTTEVRTSGGMKAVALTKKSWEVVVPVRAAAKEMLELEVVVRDSVLGKRESEEKEHFRRFVEKAEEDQPMPEHVEEVDEEQDPPESSQKTTVRSSRTPDPIETISLLSPSLPPEDIPTPPRLRQPPPRPRRESTPPILSSPPKTPLIEITISCSWAEPQLYQCKPTMKLGKIWKAFADATGKKEDDFEWSDGDGVIEASQKKIGDVIYDLEGALEDGWHILATTEEDRRRLSASRDAGPNATVAPT